MRKTVFSARRFVCLVLLGLLVVTPAFIQHIAVKADSRPGTEAQAFIDEYTDTWLKLLYT